MKKKIRIVIFIIMLFAGIMGLFFCFNTITKKENNYVVLNGSLVCNNEFYYKCELDLKARELGAVLGYTTDGDQVYSIKDQDCKDWICLRCAGEEYIYHSSKITPITDFLRLNICKIEIRDLDGIEVVTTLNDKNGIEELTSQIQDKNIVIGDIHAQEMKQITYCLEDYPGLIYNSAYIIDKNDEHFLYDFNLDTTWKLMNHVFVN